MLERFPMAIMPKRETTHSTKIAATISRNGRGNNPISHNTSINTKILDIEIATPLIANNVVLIIARKGSCKKPRSQRRKITIRIAWIIPIIISKHQKKAKGNFTANH